jgi:hypothetical protein
VPKLRLPVRRRRGGRWLALGVAAAVIALPGVAHADTGSGPLAPGSVPGPVGDLLDQVTDQTQQGSGDRSPSPDSSASQQQATQQQAAQQDANPQDPTTQDTPAPPRLPPQLQQLLDQLQPNPKCSAAIQADLTKLLTDIPTLVQAVVTDLLDQLSSGTPPSPQELLGQLQGLLGPLQGQQSAAAAEAGPSPDPTVILTDLQQLITDLTTTCAPSTPSQPSPPANPPPPGNPPPPAQGVSRPQPAAPVSYPGYAPTGSLATTALRPASDRQPSDPVPLSALGGVLLVSAAAAVGVRSRARRGGR